MTAGNAPRPPTPGFLSAPFAARASRVVVVARRVIPVFSFLAFVGAAWLLYHVLREYHYGDIVREIRSHSLRQVLTALAFVAGAYAALTGYDLLAVRFLGRDLSYPSVAATSFLAYACSNTIGLSVVSGGAIRYRLYTSRGFSAVEVAQIVVFCTVTFWVGFLATGAAVFGIDPPQRWPDVVPAILRGRLMAAPFALLLCAYLWVVVRGTSKRVSALWPFPMPTAGIVAGQFAVSMLDWTLCGAVLYELLPHAGGLSFPHFLGYFLLAQVLGIASNVPGGIGVFESMMVVLLMPYVGVSRVVGSLLVFRVLYYLLPFSLAAFGLVAQETMRHRAELQTARRAVAAWFLPLVPQILTIGIFLSGALLLISGTTPSEGARLRWLYKFLPLAVIEASHLAGSVVGAALLLLARGVQRRLDGAYHATLGLIVAGIVASLLKGYDYEEALFLSLVLALLIPCRHLFHRKASFLQQRFTPRWNAMIAIAFAASLWLGFFSYKHAEYTSQSWFHFALHGDAPRFLRASVGAMSVLVLFSLMRLLRPGRPGAFEPEADLLDKTQKAAAASADTTAYLALTGDKRLLFSESGQSFLMFAVHRRSWIVMGDPIGDPQESAELVWRFCDFADEYDAWPVFYEVGAQNMPLYVELGLTVMKIGEEARVDLGRFSLEGGKRAGLRHLMRRMEAEGVTFEVAPAEKTREILPALRAISDAWLARKNTQEKRFSIGSFDEDYLSRFPMALVRRENRVLAFSNVWPGLPGTEISADLMRYADDAPKSTMDFLFANLMLWGKQQGYRWFNLGMAPLAGLDRRRQSPLWHKIGGLVYRHGEHFYNFQGLRLYKEKFDPVWEPRYLASPGGLALPQILTHLAATISGGLRGVLAK